MDSDDQYQVTIAKYGTRSTVRSEVYLNYGTYQEADDPIRMDYFFWIARNSSRTILIDTGFSRHGGDVRGRDTLIEVPELYARLGVDPASSPQIVLTHAHFDHAGNLDLFPGSSVLMAQSEHEFWNGPHAHHPLFHHSVEDDDLGYINQIRAEGRLEFFSGRHSVAPGIEIIELGGHTPGQSIVKVDTSDGVVLLASDAIHYYEEYEREMPFVSVAELVEMYAGFTTIRSMVSSGEIDHLVSGHDPDTLSRFTPAAGDLAPYVSTIGAAS